MICIWYFSICLSLLVSLEWLANQTHHTAPVNFRVFVPAYVHYEMLLYILMEYLYPSHITAWRSLNCPIHQCQTSACTFWNLNLIYVFLFCSLISLHIFIASASQNFKIHIKKIWKYSLCNYVAQKTHMLCFKMQQIKPSFLFLLGFHPHYFLLLAPL